MNPIPVKLYGLSTCTHCMSVKILLDACGVPYEFNEIDKATKDRAAALMEEIKRLSSKCAFPTTVIGDRVIVGYREKEIKEALGL